MQRILVLKIPHWLNIYKYDITIYSKHGEFETERSKLWIFCLAGTVWAGRVLGKGNMDSRPRRCLHWGGMHSTKKVDFYHTENKVTSASYLCGEGFVQLNNLIFFSLIPVAYTSLLLFIFILLLFKYLYLILVFLLIGNYYRCCSVYRFVFYEHKFNK